MLGPIPLKTQVAYVDSALDKITLVDLAGEQPVLGARHIGRRAIHAVPSNDRHFLFVITRGEEAIKHGQVDQPPQFWVVDTQNDDVKSTAYAIGSPFDRIAVAPDNSIAIAYFSAAGPDAAGFFRNPERARDHRSHAAAGPRQPGSRRSGRRLGPRRHLCCRRRWSAPAARGAHVRVHLSAKQLTILDANTRRDARSACASNSAPC